MNKIEFALEDCITRIQVGNESPEDCLALYPELQNELRPMLAAALKLRALGQLMPAEGFRSRTRSALLAQMQSNPRRKNNWRGSFAFQAAGSLAALLLLFVSSGTALAQGALPGDVLYGWKLTSESVWRSFQASALSADMALTRRRIDELQHVSGMPDLEKQAIDGYSKLIDRLGVTLGQEPEDTIGARAELFMQKEQLKELFSQSAVEDLPDLDDLFHLIPPSSEMPQDSLESEQDEAELEIPLLITPPPPTKKEEDPGEPEGDQGWLEDLSDMFGLP